MKNRTATITIFILFAAGLSLLLYPLLANQWNTYRQSRLITDYDEAVAELAETGALDYSEEWEQALSYNESLVPYILPDAFAAAEASEEDAEYMSRLNLTGDGMMGYIRIPKINVRIPVFHTTDEEVLQKGAGHLEGSSLPVGGAGTHAVISAHRGLPSAALFTDLDRLQEGDYFFLNILDATLCYQVDQITVVDPRDTRDLAAEEGEDLVTLLTCTPYGVNSHRLLVRGRRTSYEDLGDEMTPAASALTGSSLHTNYLLWVLAGLAATGGFIVILYLYDRKRGKQADAGLGDSAGEKRHEE